MKTKKVIPRDKQQLYYIKWLDAHAENGWKSEVDLNTWINEEDCIIEEVGWIVYRDDKVIGMCSRRLCFTEKNINENTYQFGLLQKIPNPWIIELKKLKQQ